jgi:hypothetical protein
MSSDQVRKVCIEIVSDSDRDPQAWVVIRVPVDLSDPVDREVLLGAVFC